MALEIEKIGANSPMAAGQSRRKWTVEEYYKLAEIGLFDGEFSRERVELIDGDVYRLHPPSEDEHLRRWTVDEYYKIYQAGLLDGQRVELIDGEILTMSPMATPHAICLMKTNAVFVKRMPEHLMVRPQLPLRLSSNGELEPDIAIVQRDMALDLTQNPSTAVLVIEVSDSTLKYDQTAKMNLYAAAGIAEYWILNLQNRRLEIHRQPIEDATQQFGHRYNSLQNLTEENAISPLCAPTVSVNVAELWP